MTNEPTQHRQSLPKWASPLLLTLALGVVVALVWRSRSWPLFHDAPLMHYVAWRVTEGDIPYSDLFDMNFPGTYLIHLMIVKVLGAGDVGWRVFDLGWLGATVAAMAIVLRPLPGASPWLGGLLYAGYHLSAGPVQAGQRDYLLLLPIFLGVHFTARYWEHLRLRDMALAGLFLGAATLIKPTPALLWGGLGLCAAIPAYRAGRAPLKPTLVAFLTGCVPLGLGALWLVSLDGLGPFVEMLTGYVLPLYSKVGRVGLVGFISPRHWAFVGLVCALAVGALWSKSRAGGAGARRGLLLGGMVYGFIHYAAQGKGWGYHLVILVAFAASLAASGFGAMSRRPALWRWGMMAGWAALWLLVGVKGWRGGGLGPQVRARIAQVEAMQTEVQQCAQGGRAVQVLDTAHGAIHALLLEKVRQPTRFIYDFPLFHDTTHPYIQGLRAELMAGLQAAPPGCVILVEEGWPDGGYERFAELTELMAFLDARYQLNHDRDGYRVYARR